MTVEVKYIDFGLGYRVGDVVYLNKDLLDPKFQELHDKILEHEQQHGSGYNFKDFWHDFKLMMLHSMPWKFMFKYPRAFMCFYPFAKLDGTVHWSPMDIGLYIFSAIMGGILIWMR